MAEALHAELDALSKRLEDRISIVHFAWSFGLGCVAFVAVGVSLKLFLDSIRTPMIAYGLMALGLGCVTWGLLRLVRGARLYASEMRDYRRLLAVRAELGLDRPQLPA